MRARLIDAMAFVVGAILAYMLGAAADDLPWPVRLALNLLTPGCTVGVPIVAIVSMIGLYSMAFFFIVLILTNGLIFALVSSLIRNARTGRRPARVALALVTATWVIWGVVWTIQAWPWAERVAPVDLASSFAGRWIGVMRSPRGDAPITLVCHPHTDHTLDGYLYFNDHDMGPFDEGACAGDSLWFGMVGYLFRAHLRGRTMVMVCARSTLRDTIDLQFVYADTSRPVLPERRFR